MQALDHRIPVVHNADAHLVLWLSILSSCLVRVPTIRNILHQGMRWRIVSVLWVYCECTVSVLWVYCECAVSVLWVYCECIVICCKTTPGNIISWIQNPECLGGGRYLCVIVLPFSFSYDFLESYDFWMVMVVLTLLIRPAFMNADVNWFTM
mgnify:CR=1 FL=1